MKMVSLLFQNEGGEKHIVWGTPVKAGNSSDAVDIGLRVRQIGYADASRCITNIRRRGRAISHWDRTLPEDILINLFTRLAFIFAYLVQLLVNVVCIFVGFHVCKRWNTNLLSVSEKNSNVPLADILIWKRRKYHCKQVYLQEADRAAVAFLILTTVRKSLSIHKDVARHIAKAIYNSHENTEWAHAAPFVVPVTDE